MKYIYLLTFIILASCGSRKVAINKQEKEVETKIVENKVTTDSSNVEIKFNYELDIFTVEAKDNLKPFTYNNKTYFNVVLRHENKKDNTLYKKDIRVVKNESKVSNIKSKEVIKQKNTEKDNYNVKYYILFLIILLLIIYYILKRYLRVI
jgi:ATP-dependent Zn protease